MNTIPTVWEPYSNDDAIICQPIRHPFQQARPHGIEALCEGSLPPLMSFIEDVGPYRHMIRTWKRIFGFEPVYGQEYQCGQTPGCRGCFEISPTRNTRNLSCAFVSDRFSCACLRNRFDNLPLPLRLVLVTKFEKPMDAIHCIAKYFAFKLILFPIRINDLKKGEYELVYPGIGNKTTSVNVRVLELTDGFYVDPKIIGWVKTDMVCVQCRYQNGAESRNTDVIIDSKMRNYFYLECESHLVCEECVLELFAKRDLNYERDRPFALNERIYSCPIEECWSHIKGRVVGSIGIGTEAMVPAPIPIGYFGAKPFFSDCLKDSHSGFFRRHCSHVLPIFGLVKEKLKGAYKELGDTMVEIAAILEQIKSGDLINCTHVKYREMGQTKIDLESDIAVLKELNRFLDNRRFHMEFALQWGEPFPEEFLNLNAQFYEEELNRTVINKYIFRLKHVYVPAIGVYGAV